MGCADDHQIDEITVSRRRLTGGAVDFVHRTQLVGDLLRQADREKCWQFCNSVDIDDCSWADGFGVGCEDAARDVDTESLDGGRTEGHNDAQTDVVTLGAGGCDGEAVGR